MQRDADLKLVYSPKSRKPQPPTAAPSTIKERESLQDIYTEVLSNNWTFFLVIFFFPFRLSFSKQRQTRSTFATDRRTQLILFSTSLRFTAAALSCIHSFTHSFIHPSIHPCTPPPPPSRSDPLLLSPDKNEMRKQWEQVIKKEPNECKPCLTKRYTSP